MKSRAAILALLLCMTAGRGWSQDSIQKGDSVDHGNENAQTRHLVRQPKKAASAVPAPIAQPQQDQTTHKEESTPLKCDERGWLARFGCDPMVLFTMLLTIFTGGLLRVGWRQGNQIDRDFLAAHRPRVVVRPTMQQHGMSYKEGTWKSDATISLQIVNVGDSEALLLEVRASHFVTWHNHQQSFYSQAPSHPIPAKVQLAPGVPFEMTYKHTFAVAESGTPDAILLARQVSELIFYGTVRYVDKTKRERECGFCRGWIAGGWRTIQEPQREYDA